MARVRELSADDISAIRSIAGHYLSTFEIEENSELFTAACNEADGTLGRGVERESGLVGFLVATVCARDEPLDAYFNRPTPVTSDSRSLILQHLYVEPEQRGRGYGSALLDAVLSETDERAVDTVYAEAWINPAVPDAVPLLESHGFDETYHEDNYWAHEEFVASAVPCPTHDKPYAACPCEGAVYTLESA